ncbi:hypothetical protein [Clostridium ganghwense]|uniref:Phage protein n=1 Tax=Clostridium ganghwense TaxID=312089 RepID=A0ABT4CTS0_9CLOT|nr:hypothetical protein [Clostridium ganghwense]MCY6372462.1 hypothetical protein [Clostridium ganghwense]
MSLNIERIKQQVKRGIAIKPTHIKLIRKEKISNGMRGGKEKPVDVAELDVFIDDSKHSLSGNLKESGKINRIRSLTMLAVAEGFEIKEGDYFIANEIKYRVTYPGMLVEGVYNSDLEVVK